MSNDRTRAAINLAPGGSATAAGRSLGRVHSRSRRTLYSLGLLVGSILLIATIIAYATFVFGNVEGVEFAADAFLRRKFDYYEIPLLRIQVSGVERSDSTGPVENYLLAQKLVQLSTQASSTTRRWDLVSARQNSVPRAFGEAGILCRYLDMRDTEGAHLWLSWSKDHPELARILWPEVQNVAEKQLYFLIPELFQRARQATDGKRFRTEIKQLLAARFLWLADTEQQLGRVSQADAYRAAARAYDPET
jgi:hypothetical protein